VQVRVKPTTSQELIAGTLFFDRTMVQSHNSVNPFERGDPVRNENNGLIGEVRVRSKRTASCMR
jgi:hypothetical protein